MAARGLQGSRSSVKVETWAGQARKASRCERFEINPRRTAPLLPTRLFSSSRLALTGLRHAQMASQTRQLAIKTGVVNRCAVCPLIGLHAILLTGLGSPSRDSPRLALRM